MKKGVLITADLHLRDDVPVCRTDDFQKAQWDKLRQIAEIVRRERLYWVDCGDIFHKARPSYKLVNRFIDSLRMWGVQIDIAICGNHDMPAHSMGQLDDSAFGTLTASKTIKQWAYGHPRALEVGNKVFEFYGVNYTETPYAPNDYADDKFVYIMLLHDMVFPNKKEALPGVEGVYAADLCAEYTGLYDYIFCGHNHNSFDYAKGDCELYNVGCLTRQTADMAEYRPRVCILNEQGNVTTRYLMGLNKNAVSREHIEKQNANEEQILSFVESLGEGQEISLSYEGNVKIVVNKVKPAELVRQKVQGAME